MEKIKPKRQWKGSPPPQYAGGGGARQRGEKLNGRGEKKEESTDRERRVTENLRKKEGGFRQLLW